MHVLFVQRQPCIRALKYAEGLRATHPDIGLSFAYSGKTLTELYGQGDECFGEWFPLGADAAAVLRKVVSTRHVDLIHCHNLPDALTCLCIDLFGGRVPVVHDIHDLMSARETEYEDGAGRAGNSVHWREEERRAVEGSDAVVAVSDEILRIARDRGYRLPAVTHVHPNYVPERFVPKALPAVDPDRSDGPVRIVYEGFLSSRGGHYDLRAVFRSLAAEGVELHLYPSRPNPDYEAMAVDSPNVFYHSHLPPGELLEEIKRYDFGWAGFNGERNRVHLDTVLPNKLFEYIACGLPVLSFPNRALRRFIEKHRVGLVVDGVTGLAGRLRSPEADALRENVRRSRHDFTVEANIGRIVDLYHRLCRKPTP